MHNWYDLCSISCFCNLLTSLKISYKIAFKIINNTMNSTTVNYKTNLEKLSVHLLSHWSPLLLPIINRISCILFGVNTNTTRESLRNDRMLWWWLSRRESYQYQAHQRNNCLHLLKSERTAQSALTLINHTTKRSEFSIKHKILDLFQKCRKKFYFNMSKV